MYILTVKGRMLSFVTEGKYVKMHSNMHFNNYMTIIII